jgi:hypothetical protein
MKLRLLTYTLCLLFGLSSCIDPFDPDFSSSAPQSILVVDGLITNEPEAQVITLSKSIPIEDVNIVNNYEPVSGAKLQIIDNMGNTFPLTENVKGSYVTDPSQFQPETGSSYQLNIELNNGDVYQSDFQELKSVTPIEDVEVRSETELIFRGGAVFVADVVNLYTNIEVDIEPVYTKYSYQGTFAAISDYQGSGICWPNPNNVPDDLSSFLVCYRSEFNDLPLNVLNSEEAFGFNEQKVISQVLDRRFAIGYSMLLKKYSLTQSHFDFLSTVKQQQNVGGSLFDPPPTIIVGNISKVNEQDEKILGFFAISAVTSKRIFIDNLVVRSIPLEAECIYDPLFYPDSKPEEFCCDCRLFPGATDQMPEFWGE